MNLALSFWLAKRSHDVWRKTNARQDMRWRLHQQTKSFPKGKGNKAWKRAAELERKWRQSGGFYVADLI